MQYDALNRIRTMYYPQDLDSERKQVLPVYNKSGALVSVDIKDNPSATPVNYIQRMAYNAKGQPLLVAFGNGVMTRYLYREDNFRLLRMKSEKYSVSDLTYTPSSGTVKQNYTYGYDLSGNIISINDTTPDCGYGPTPDSLTREFSYDALYRLLSASGRETAAYSSVPWQDFYRPENTSLARGYTQTYDYDKLGNIQSLQHVATGGSFTRAFDYVSGKNSLASITIGSNVYNFSHDVNGNITSEGDTARHLQYDFADRLRCFFVQTGTAEPSKYTQYLYDGSGQRVKKITRKQGGGYSSTSYIDGLFEYTKETSTFDAIPNLEIGSWVIGQYSSGGEQNILHIMGGATRRVGDSLGDSTPAIKFALTDQLGSSNLLVDDVGTNVNREEYYPFGETSFGSYAKKRYKFCGKERDEESGLYYYGMRYYSPWTCRFISVDPMAATYPMKTPYHYCSNNPINNIDPTGAEDVPGGGGAPGQSGGNSGGGSGTAGNSSPSSGSHSSPEAYRQKIENSIEYKNFQPVEGPLDKWEQFHSQGGLVNNQHQIELHNTYYSLAIKYNTSVDNLIKWNNNKPLIPGELLTVFDPNPNIESPQLEVVNYTTPLGETISITNGTNIVLKGGNLWDYTDQYGDSYNWRPDLKKYTLITADRPPGQNSFPGSAPKSVTYAGSDNPLYKYNKSIYDYSLRPMSITDYYGMLHDLEYDSLNASGPNDVFLNLDTAPADLRLAERMKEVMKMYLKGYIDPFTNETISVDTVRNAMLIYSVFSQVGTRKEELRKARNLIRKIKRTF
jgi:RHS repeat-associated protein